MDHLSFQNADGNLFSDEPLDPETLSTGKILEELMMHCYSDNVDKTIFPDSEANLFTDDFDPAHSTGVRTIFEYFRQRADQTI